MFHLEKFIALMTTHFTDHNRSISNNETPMITLPIVEFDRQANYNVEYEGFGIANVNVGSEFDEEIEPTEENIKLAKSLNCLVNVGNSLNLRTPQYNKQGVLTSCPLKGLQFFTTQRDLSRRLSDFNVTAADRLEKTLNRAILNQYKNTIAVDGNVPQWISLKVSHD